MNRRPSWNAFDERSEDLPSEKMSRFHNVVLQAQKEDPIYQATMKILYARDKKQPPAPDFIKKVVETVRQRKKDIIEFQASQSDQALQDLASESILKLTEDLIKSHSEAEFFVEEPKILLPRELNKRIVQEIFQTISKLESAHKKQMEDEVLEEEEELETVEYPARKDRTSDIKPKEAPLKAVRSKLKLALLKRDSGLQKPPKKSKEAMETIPEVKSSTVTLRFNKKTTLLEMVEEEPSTIFREPFLRQQKDYSSEERNSEVEEKEEMPETKLEPKEMEPGLKLFVTSLTNLLESDEVPNKKSRLTLKKSLSRMKFEPPKTKPTPTAQIQSSSADRFPSLEVINLSKSSLEAKKAIVAEESHEEMEDAAGETLRIDPEEKPKTRRSKRSSSTKEDEHEPLDLKTFVRQTADHLGHMDEVSERNVSMERRGIRTAEDRRFSIDQEATQHKRVEHLAVRATYLGGHHKLESTPKNKTFWRNQKAIQMHEDRIKNSRKIILFTRLSRRTSTLPHSLRKEYFSNYEKGGSEGSVFTRVQNKQKLLRNSHVRYIMEASLQRLTDANDMKDEALAAEIAVLEELVKKSQPSVEVKKEEARRQELIRRWASSGVVTSSQYWRIPQKGRLGMKEYMRETTFEDILSQRGFFGRKIQRPSNSFYVPVTKSQATLLRNQFFGNYQNGRKESLSGERNKKYQKRMDGKLIIRAKEEPKENIEEEIDTEVSMEGVAKINPFAYRTAGQRGRIRHFESEIIVGKGSAREQKDLKGAGRGKPTPVQAPLKKIKQNEPFHRFANKTNKGFLQSFFEVYDVSRGKNVLSYPF